MRKKGRIRASGKQRYLDTHMRFADFGYPTLNTVDSEITQEPIPFILTYTEHAEEGKRGLDELDEFENGGAKEVGGTYLIVHAVHGDETVFGGIPVWKSSFSPQVMWLGVMPA